MSLAEKVVIVTGAGKGLGRAYAVHLAREGAHVLVNNRRHAGERDAQTSAMATVNIIRRQGGQAEPNYCDVTDPASGAAMVDHACSHFGDLHGIVANAGVERLARFESLSEDDFKQVFDTSFFGNLYLISAAWKHWQATGFGRAVLTGSGAGLYGNHGQVAYSAAKAAVIGLVRALAIETGKRDICVNAVAPYAYTAMTKPHLSADDAAKLDPSHVAPLVSYLMSAQCTLSGETLVSAGGLIRRAYTREGRTVALGDDIATAINTLLIEDGASFESASASFGDLCNTLHEDQGQQQT